MVLKITILGMKQQNVSPKISLLEDRLTVHYYIVGPEEFNCPTSCVQGFLCSKHRISELHNLSVGLIS